MDDAEEGGTPLGHNAAEVVSHALDGLDWAPNEDPFSFFACGVRPVKPHSAQCEAAAALHAVLQRDGALELRHLEKARAAGRAGLRGESCSAWGA